MMQRENQEEMKQRLSEMKRELAKKEKKLELKSRLQSMKNELAKTQKKLKKADRTARAKAHVQKKLKDLAEKSSPENFKESNELDVKHVSDLVPRVNSPDCDRTPDLLVDAIPPSPHSAQLSEEQRTVHCTDTPLQGDKQVVPMDPPQGKTKQIVISTDITTCTGFGPGNQLRVSDSERNFSSTDVTEKVSLENTSDDSSEICQVEVNNDRQYHISEVNVRNCPKTMKAPEDKFLEITNDSQNVTASKDDRTVQNSEADKSGSQNKSFLPQNNCVQSDLVKTLDIDNNVLKYTETVNSKGDTSCESRVTSRNRPVTGDEPGMYIPIKRRTRTRKQLSLRKERTEILDEECNTLESSTPDDSNKSSQNITQVNSVEILDSKTCLAVNAKTKRSDGHVSGDAAMLTCKDPVLFSENIVNKCTLDMPQEIDSGVDQDTERKEEFRENLPDSLNKSAKNPTRIPPDIQLILKENTLETGCTSDIISFDQHPRISVGKNEQGDSEITHSSQSSLVDSVIVISSQTASAPRKRRRRKSRNWSSIVPPRKSPRISSVGSSQSPASLNGSFLQSFSQDACTPNCSDSCMILPKWFDGVSQSFLSQSPRSRRKKSRKIFPSLPRLVLEQHRFTVNFVEFSLPEEQFAEFCGFQRTQNKKPGCIEACQSNPEQDGPVYSNAAKEVFAQSVNYVDSGCTVDSPGREASLISENVIKELLTDGAELIDRNLVEFSANATRNKAFISENRTAAKSNQSVKIITAEGTDNTGYSSLGKPVEIYFHEQREINNTQYQGLKNKCETENCVPSFQGRPHAAIHSNNEIGEEIERACIPVGTPNLPRIQENMTASIAESNKGISISMVDVMKVADVVPSLTGTCCTRESVITSSSATLLTSQSLSPTVISSSTGLNCSYDCSSVVKGNTGLSHHLTEVNTVQAQRCFQLAGDERIQCLLSGEFLHDEKTTDYVAVVSEYSVSVWIQKSSKWESLQTWPYTSRCGECTGSALPANDLISFLTVRKNDGHVTIEIYACGTDGSFSSCTSIYSSPVENYKRFHYCVLGCGDVAMSEFCEEKNQSDIWKCVLEKDCNAMVIEQKFEPVCEEVNALLNIPTLDDALLACSTDACLHIWSQLSRSNPTRD